MGAVFAMIVMALGDTHGNRGFTKQAITWASENGVDRIVQVGDFGFWPRTNNGQKFLHDVGKHSVQMGVPLFFIDGNHEDHLYLKAMRERHEDADFIHYSKSYPVTYINRGARWLWGDVWFGAFGGAFSIDRAWRTEDSAQYGWFKEEVPDESKIPSLGKVDVLFTHDSPIIPPSVYGFQHFKSDETSRESQAAVYNAVVASKPALVIHGHWHLNERYKVAGAVIQALDMDQSTLYRAAVVFDTDTKKLYNLMQWEHREDS